MKENFAISFAVIGDAQMSFLVPNSSIEDGTDLETLGLSDFDRWNKLGVDERQIEVVAELTVTATWESGHWLVNDLSRTVTAPRPRHER